MKKLIWLHRIGGGGGVETIYTGTAPFVLTKNVGKTLLSLRQNGLVQQSSTPNPSSPVPLVCNNGTLMMVDDELPSGYTHAHLEVVGTPEVISVGGKNLNGGVIENKGYTSTGGESTSTTFAGTLWKISCKEGDKFTVSWGGFPDGVSGVFINTWKTDGTWNTRQAISASTTLTYTIGVGIGTVNFTLYKTGGITIGENAWLQVEYGASATDHEPYRTPYTASAENLFAVGDYADTQDIISGAVNRNVGVLVLDGTETELWTIQSNRVYARMENLGIAVKLGDDTVRLLCTHSSNTSVNTLGAVFLFFTTADYNISTVADWNAFLASQYSAGTPVIVLYPLAEPIIDQVDPQAIPVEKGDVTVTTEANVSPITFTAVYKKQKE